MVTYLWPPTEMADRTHAPKVSAVLAQPICLGEMGTLRNGSAIGADPCSCGARCITTTGMLVPGRVSAGHFSLPEASGGTKSLLAAAFVNPFKSAGGDVRWLVGMTSRTCSECGHANGALGPSREFRCEKCGSTADRELNSGRNLINEHRNGHSASERRSTRVRKPSPVLNTQELCEKAQVDAEVARVASVS